MILTHINGASTYPGVRNLYLQRVIIWFGRLGLRGRVRVNFVAMVGLVSC